MKAGILFIAMLCAMLFLQSSGIGARKVVRAPREETLSVYEAAELATGAPAEILRAIAITESLEDDKAIGDDGVSRGRMQINEAYRAERIAKYGKYDPHDPRDSVMVAGFIFVDNLARLGDIDKAIAAHRQGVDGVRKYGVDSGYLARVKSNLLAECVDIY